MKDGKRHSYDGAPEGAYGTPEEVAAYIARERESWDERDQGATRYYDAPGVTISYGLNSAGVLTCAVNAKEAYDRGDEFVFIRTVEDLAAFVERYSSTAIAGAIADFAAQVKDEVTSGRDSA